MENERVEIKKIVLAGPINLHPRNTFEAGIQSPVKVIMSWNKVAGAEKYEIEVKRITGKEKINKLFSETNQSEIDLEGIYKPPYIKYSWRVRSVVGKNKSDWSKSEIFKVSIK